MFIQKPLIDLTLENDCEQQSLQDQIIDLRNELEETQEQVTILSMRTQKIPA